MEDGNEDLFNSGLRDLGNGLLKLGQFFLKSAGAEPERKVPAKKSTGAQRGRGKGSAAKAAAVGTPSKDVKMTDPTEKPDPMISGAAKSLMSLLPGNVKKVKAVRKPSISNRATADAAVTESGKETTASSPPAKTAAVLSPRPMSASAPRPKLPPKKKASPKAKAVATMSPTKPKVTPAAAKAKKSVSKTTASSEAKSNSPVQPRKLSSKVRVDAEERRQLEAKKEARKQVGKEVKENDGSESDVNSFMSADVSEEGSESESESESESGSERESESDGEHSSGSEGESESEDDTDAEAAGNTSSPRTPPGIVLKKVPLIGQKRSRGAKGDTAEVHSGTGKSSGKITANGSKKRSRPNPEMEEKIAKILTDIVKQNPHIVTREILERVTSKEALNVSENYLRLAVRRLSAGGVISSKGKRGYVVVTDANPEASETHQNSKSDAPSQAMADVGSSSSSSSH